MKPGTAQSRSTGDEDRDHLAKNPDDALDPDIAYDVMSYGMRNGSFSQGNALSTYINAITCDYLRARRIINGQDVAALIQGYAEDLEMLLCVSCSGSFSDSPLVRLWGLDHNCARDS